MGIKITKITFFPVILQCILTLNSYCIPAYDNDITAIKKLFLRFEQGYEERNIEKYMSVFSYEQFTYTSDMATPDDPSDDIRFSRAEDERRSAIKVFDRYENLDLELTDMEFVVNGDSAEVKARIKIVFVVFQENGCPEVYYAIVKNTFNLKKFDNQWKIIRWQQNEMLPETLAAWSQQESKSKSISDLIRDLGNPNMVKWAIAMSDLRKNIDTSMDELIKALRSSNKNLRIRSAWTLAGNNNNAVIQEFIKILKNENEDVDIRIAVINSAVACDNQDIDDELMIAIKSSEPRIRAVALLAFAKRIRKQIDDLYIYYCNEPDETVRKSAIESLKIIMSLPQGDINKGIESGYKSESEEIRLASMEFLERLRPDSAPEIFRDKLKDKNESLRVRVLAAQKLGELKDNSSLDLLLDIAKDKKEAKELQKAAINSLGYIGGSKTVKLLVDFLNSSDPVFRHEAIKALNLLADQRSLKPLMMVLMNRNEDDWIRRLAGNGVIKIDQNIGIGPLVQILKDETETATARRMAAEVLASLNNAKVVSIFAEVINNKQQPWWLRRIAVNCLAQAELCKSLTSPCAESLKLAMNDPDERVSKAARDALAHNSKFLSIRK